MRLLCDGVRLSLLRRALLAALATGMLGSAPRVPHDGGGSTLGKHNGLDASTKVVPEKAREVFQYVLEHGKAPKGYVGGRVWHNREGRLPAGGDYREYDVNPKIKGVNRGPERIIIDRSTGKGYYTADHYKTFMPVDSR